MKNYEIEIIAYCSVLVLNAEDEDQALEYAMDKVMLGNMQLDEASVVKEVPDDEVDEAKKHADVISKN